MKVSELLDRRREQWRELEELCRQMEGRRLRRSGGAAVARFAGLYRAACADLALADAYQLPPELVDYLNLLIGRAHNQLYRSQTFRWREWGHTMFVELPYQLVCDRALWLAMVIFWGTFAVSLMLAFESRRYTEQVVGEAGMAKIQEMYSKPVEGRDPDSSGLMAGFYVYHNAGIGLRCFAAGLLLGVGGLFATVFNSVQLGAVFGFMLTTEQRTNFMHFVTAHGPFELTAIVFSAAAGMRLGFSLVSTGGLRRLDSLVRAAVDATPMMGAAVLLFSLAAMIEGFVSPSALPYAVKAAVGLFSAGLLLFYVVGLGLWRRR
jgi:uncharacterized membrane protein SpoIIM required for sporulation